MLEYALKQERYLQEVGYTDTILDVRSQRVRSLLGLSGSEQNGSVETKNLEQILNGGDSPAKQKGQDLKRNPGDVLETFNFLENADDSDEDDDDDEEGDLVADITGGKQKHRINKKHKIKIGNEGLAADLPDDPDTEEALKEFDFLVTAEDGEGAGEARSSGDGTEWANKDAFRKTWNPKYTLRSHFDGVRSLVFHPVEPVLVTASEDHTLKLWNLQKTVPAKKQVSYYSKGPVLSLAISSSGEHCFSGGIDAAIQWWNMPSSNVDPYDTYDPNVLAGTFLGHTDAVWGLAFSGIKNRLLSCSADGTIRLWNSSEKSPCISTYNAEKEHGIPTSVDFNGCDPAHMVASFHNGNTVIYDLETSRPSVVLASQVDASKLIHAMVAHLDAVTSLAVDPNGIYLMSGSHDCSIRLWNLDSKTCVQEITAHRKKSDESIYDVAFHPSKAYIASAGADALAKVFV
ncbi:UNVERIFIED_CONTAM: hypothetical protein FKN15_074889 [Acipenser sinensis]